MMSRPLTSSWEARKAAQRAALEAQVHQKEALFRAAMERKRAAEAAQREAAFEELCNKVLGGLQHGSGVLSDVQEVLQYADAAQRAHKEALYKQWHSLVFEPMQGRLSAAMSQSSISSLEASLQAASQAYVTASNTKRLFRDVIMDDYNPLAPLANSIRIPTADLADPLLHDLVKTQVENDLLSTDTTTFAISTSGSRPAVKSGSRGTSSQGQLITRGCNGGSSSYGIKTATTRPMLETTRWAAGQIHATPYGHCIDDATANYIVRPAPTLSLAQRASHIHFDDFTPT